MSWLVRSLLFIHANARAVLRSFTLLISQLYANRLVFLNNLIWQIISHPQAQHRHRRFSKTVTDDVKAIQAEDKSNNSNRNGNVKEDKELQGRLQQVQQRYQGAFVCSQVFLGMVEVLRDYWYPGVSPIQLTATTLSSTQSITNDNDNNNSNNNSNNYSDNRSSSSSASSTAPTIPLTERQAYVSCVLASLLGVPEVPDTLAKTFLATCVFCSGMY